MDWDNDEEEEGNYVLCAKYKRRYMQLHRKIAEYKQMSNSLGRLVICKIWKLLIMRFVQEV